MQDYNILTGWAGMILGALLGLLVAAGAVAVVGRNIAGFGDTMRMTSGIFVGGLGWAVLLGLVTGAIPAWSAMRLQIAVALGRK